MLDFLEQSAEVVAPQLLGWRLLRELDGKLLEGVIVETEAYDQTDAASHSYRGKTPRTEVMFGSSGVAYVYFTYGMHYCFNIVTGKPGEGSAVLIRALEPVQGMDVMTKRRNGRSDLCNGPAKLCQALGIDKQMNGHDMTKSPFWLEPPLVSPRPIAKSERIGISKDTHRLWRFYIEGNEFISQ